MWPLGCASIAGIVLDHFACPRLGLRNGNGATNRCLGLGHSVPTAAGCLQNKYIPCVHMCHVIARLGLDPTIRTNHLVFTTRTGGTPCGPMRGGVAVGT